MVTPNNVAKLRKPRYSVSRSVTDRTIEHILQGLDCPRSLAVHMLYKYGEHQQLVDKLEWSPSAYDSSIRARDSYLATELLSKSKFLKLDVDPELAAITGFLETEERCRETNKRFARLDLDPDFVGTNVWMLNAVKRQISRLLGEVPESQENFQTSFCPVEWFDSCRWGPGTTYRISGKATNSTYKFQCDAGMTKDCYMLVSPLLSAACPLWAAHLMQRFPTWGRSKVDMWLETGEARYLNGKMHAYFDPGNIVLAVPKKAKIHRIISKEPGINCYFQLGVGTMMRHRLLRYGGFDLRDQSRNQRLAFQASLSDQDATVDHKDASGLIATMLIRETFPSRWFSVMDSLRSKCGVYHRKGQEPLKFYYEKFSSMGNGFTFPLQSTLFAAIALSACEFHGLPTTNVGVYGDDVILPKAAYDTYSQFAQFCGLLVNRTKSFTSGPFRESCGAHYWEGADLKPLYIKERLSGLSSVFRLANGVRRLSARNHTSGCDSRFLPTWRYLQARVPKEMRYSIPEGYGDGGFIENFDEATPATQRRWAQFDPKTGLYQGIEGYYGKSLTLVPIRYRTNVHGLLLARLSDLGLREEDLDYDEIRFLTGSGNEVGLRRTTRAVVQNSLYPTWNNLGPWSSSLGSIFLRAC